MNNNYDELYHHGIFGMKWGKKNGPPYPLKPGDHSASEKKAGWRKSLKDEHPDNKYFDSRNFGSDDLGRLTDRFNSEKAFNDALAAKLKSENMLDADKLKSMSRKQKKELYRQIQAMEEETAYNRAYQQQLQSQIDLITSQKRLSELQRKPATKVQQAKKAVGNMLVNMGKSSVERVGTEAMTYMLGTSINKVVGQDVVNVNRQKEDLAMKELKRKTDQLQADYNYQKAKSNLDNFNTQSKYKAAKDKADYYNNLKKTQDYRKQIMKNGTSGNNNSGSSNASSGNATLDAINRGRRKHGLPPIVI